MKFKKSTPISNFKIGDRVIAHSRLPGVTGKKGIIIAYSPPGRDKYPIIVQFENFKIAYTHQGHRIDGDPSDYIKLTIQNLFEEDV